MTRLVLAVLGSILLSLPSCDGNSSASRMTGEVGAGGGTIAVMSGPLAGTELVVPAAALPDGTQITIDQSATPILIGFEALGPGANFAAGTAELAMPAEARLVFDPARVPAGAAAADVVVVRQTSQGRRVTLAPTAVDLAGGSVRVQVDRLAAYWVALATLDIDFVLANYLPLFDGDTFAFDNGLVAFVDDVFDEPNLEGLFVTRLTFADGADAFGYYLRRELAETLLFGEFSTAREFQTLGIPPLVWLPATGKVGSTSTDQHAATVYEPFGSPLATDVIDVRLAVRILSQGRLDTPLGRFSDVLEIEFAIQRTDTRLQVESNTDRLWLARGVGPVQVELERPSGTRRASLIDGQVAGAPIVAD